MGHTYAKVVFHGQKQKRVVERVLVDRGATYTIMPASLAEEIGVFLTPYRSQLTLADKSRKGVSIGLVEVEVEGRREPVQIAIIDDGVLVLGVQALEALGFGVNPVSRKLEVIRDSGSLALKFVGPS